MGENPSAHDEVARRMQLEQEEFTRGERLEILLAGRPEVDFVQVRPPTEHLEPVAVGNRYYEVDTHRHLSARDECRIGSTRPVHAHTSQLWNITICVASTVRLLVRPGSILASTDREADTDVENLVERTRLRLRNGTSLRPSCIGRSPLPSSIGTANWSVSSLVSPARKGLIHHNWNVDWMQDGPMPSHRESSRNRRAGDRM